MTAHKLAYMDSHRLEQGRYRAEGACSCGEKISSTSRTGAVQARNNVFAAHREHKKKAGANTNEAAGPQGKKEWCEGTGLRRDTDHAVGWTIKPGAAYGTPTGVCPKCGRRVSLRGDGTVRSHVAELAKRER